VLDNFETIPAKEQLGCADWLRKEAPCPALITTREKIEQAHNIPVDAMSSKEAASLLDLLIGQAGNSKAFEGLNRESIIHVADANPLVLQWVVGQIDLAQDPRSTLKDLAEGKGDAAERIFLHSYNLPQLGDDGRAVLLALSLFVPGASRLALADVAGFDADMRRLSQPLKRLASLRLVSAIQKSDYFAVEGLTRELARSRLSQRRDLSLFQQRFVAFFLRFAQGSRDNPDALEAEKDNLLTALDIASDLADWSSVATISEIIADPVDGVLAVRGHWDQATRAAELLLQAARNTQDESRIAARAQNLAVIYQRGGNFGGARRLYEEALGVWEKQRDREGRARVLNDLGLLESSEGNFERARELAEESLGIKKELGGQALIASSLHHLGSLAYVQGDLASAEKFLQQSLEASKVAADQRGISCALQGLGVVEKDQGRHKEAREHLGESLRIDEGLGDQESIAKDLNVLAELEEKEGNKDEAARKFQRALKIFEKLKHRSADGVRRSLQRVSNSKEPPSDDVAAPGQ
jgi:tetratricopeptide (TPR) repeat protein